MKIFYYFSAKLPHKIDHVFMVLFAVLVAGIPFQIPALEPQIREAHSAALIPVLSVAQTPVLSAAPAPVSAAQIPPGLGRRIPVLLGAPIREPSGAQTPASGVQVSASI